MAEYTTCLRPPSLHQRAGGPQALQDIPHILIVCRLNHVVCLVQHKVLELVHPQERVGTLGGKMLSQQTLWHWCAESAKCGSIMLSPQTVGSTIIGPDQIYDESARDDLIMLSQQ